MLDPIHYSPMVYRFLDEKDIDDFFKDGNLMLSTYERCRKLEDEKRRDEQEGKNTVVKTEGKFKIVQKAGIGYNPLLLCTSLYQIDITGETTSSKFCLEIRDPPKFAEAVAQELAKLGHYVIDTYIGPCYYSDKVIEGSDESSAIESFLKESERSKTIDPKFFSQITEEVAGQHKSQQKHEYITREKYPSDRLYPKVANPEQVSDWERLFYTALFDQGIRTIPQYPVDKYKLDLAIVDGNRMLDIEIDGEMYHKDWNGELSYRDQLRNQRLFELGWDVKRFWVYQIRDDLQSCIDQIKDWYAN